METVAKLMIKMPFAVGSLYALFASLMVMAEPEGVREVPNAALAVSLALSAFGMMKLSDLAESFVGSLFASPKGKTDPGI